VISEQKLEILSFYHSSEKTYIIKCHHDSCWISADLSTFKKLAKVVAVFLDEIWLLENGELWQGGNKTFKKIATLSLNQSEKILQGGSFRTIDRSKWEILVFVSNGSKKRLLQGLFDETEGKLKSYEPGISNLGPHFEFCPTDGLKINRFYYFMGSP
jgi:hypothetical protein